MGLIVLRGGPFDLLLAGKQIGLGLGKILLQLGDLQFGDLFAFLDRVAYVNTDGFEVAGDFGMQGDFLVRIELPGELDIFDQILAGGRDHRDADGSFLVGGCPVGMKGLGHTPQGGPSQD